MRYDIIKSHSYAGQDIVIGDTEHRVCRFCGRTNPEVTFRNKAHAVPEMCGNTCIFSAHECDECNSTFSKYEHSFANMYRLYRVIRGLRGKKGKVKASKGCQMNYDDDSKRFEFFVKEDADKIPDIDFEFYEKKNAIRFTRVVNFIPRDIYKMLLRCSLNVLEEWQLEPYYNYIEFLSNNPRKQNCKTVV